jgi:hypothetical protein
MEGIANGVCAVSLGPASVVEPRVCGFRDDGCAIPLAGRSRRVKAHELT